MADTNDVYRKIKEISLQHPQPRPQILTKIIAQELSCTLEHIQSSLSELQRMRLVQMDKSGSVKLTLLGHAVKR